MFDSIKYTKDKASAMWGDFHSNMMGSAGGKGFMHGAADAFGFQYAGKLSTPDWVKNSNKAKRGWEIMMPKKGDSIGFLGMKQEMKMIKAEKAALKNLGGAGREALKSKMGAGFGKLGAARYGGMAARVGGRMLGPAFTAYSMYEGYQSGGVFGAMKGGAEAVLMNAAFSSAMKFVPSLVNPVTVGLATAAAVGYGAYTFGEAARSHRKDLRNVEMGGGYVDTFGTGATMRQRSAMALQNSHINGRSALGMEGAIYHR